MKSQDEGVLAFCMGIFSIKKADYPKVYFLEISRTLQNHVYLNTVSIKNQGVISIFLGNSILFFLGNPNSQKVYILKIPCLLSS